MILIFFAFDLFRRAAMVIALNNATGCSFELRVLGGTGSVTIWRLPNDPHCLRGCLLAKSSNDGNVATDFQIVNRQLVAMHQGMILEAKYIPWAKQIVLVNTLGGSPFLSNQPPITISVDFCRKVYFGRRDCPGIWSTRIRDTQYSSRSLYTNVAFFPDYLNTTAVRFLAHTNQACEADFFVSPPMSYINPMTGLCVL